MENLLSTIKNTINEKRELPFAVYTSIKEQKLLNVPIAKPLLIVVQGFYELTIEHICEQLAMSESTLRRKLKLEGTSVQEIKDQARLGLGLHLLQTTRHTIGVIADKCGYQSQSRLLIVLRFVLV